MPDDGGWGEVQQLKLSPYKVDVITGRTSNDRQGGANGIIKGIRCQSNLFILLTSFPRSTFVKKCLME